MPEYSEKILIVDDEKNIIDSYERFLSDDFNIDTAKGGNQALKLIENNKYAVIVSDMNMPGIDGVNLLSRVAKISPHTVRIMLTGNSNERVALNAINKGHVYNFIIKPCSPDEMKQNLIAAIKHHRLIIAEIQLLSQTLTKSLKLLSDILAIVNPEAFGRGSRIKRYVKKIAHELGKKDLWLYKTSAMLSQISCITIPEETMKKINRGQLLDEKEVELALSYPALAAKWINTIPRMEEVAKIVSYQKKNYDGSGMPEDNISKDDIPLGSRILRVCLDFDTFEIQGHKKRPAIEMLKKGAEKLYDSKIVKALEKVLETERRYQVKTVDIKQLDKKMILNKDIKTKSGSLLLSRGQEISITMIEHLTPYVLNHDIVNEFEVLVQK